MNKHLKVVCVMIAFTAMFSSCKKTTTDLSILTGHKWVLNSAQATYSDSGSRFHNLLPVDTLCQTTSYTEFHDYTSNNPLRLAYTYSSTTCQGAIGSPYVDLSSWKIDPDNTVLYLHGNTTGDGSGGTWYNIQTLSSSSLVLTIVGQNIIGWTTGPNSQPIYDTETDTYTYGTK